VEVMKTFSPVRADSPGTLARFLVTDGEAVRAGQIVALLRPLA